MKTTEFFIAATGLVHAMFVDSASFTVICGLMFLATSKRLQKQWKENSKEKVQRDWNWQECKIPSRQ
jgi:hypothetical protein